MNTLFFKYQTNIEIILFSEKGCYIIHSFIRSYKNKIIYYNIDNEKHLFLYVCRKYNTENVNMNSSE